MPLPGLKEKIPSVLANLLRNPDLARENMYETSPLHGALFDMLMEPSTIEDIIKGTVTAGPFMKIPPGIGQALAKEIPSYRPKGGLIVEDVPKRLFHTTPFAKEIAESGVIKTAPAEEFQGLGGSGFSRGKAFSAASEREAAKNIFRGLKFITKAKETPVEGLKNLIKNQLERDRVALKGKRVPVTEELVSDILEPDPFIQSYFDSVMTKYFLTRRNKFNIPNPTFIEPSKIAAKPENVGTFVFSSKKAPEGAKFGHGYDPGEIEVGADLPIGGGYVVGSEELIDRLRALFGKPKPQSAVARGLTRLEY